MSVMEKEQPFDTAGRPASRLEPGFSNEILTPELMYKEVTPFYIKTSIYNCFACENKSFKKPLELSNFNASVMVIGEVPTDTDFQTPEGKLLADTLLWAGYDLKDIYFTSLVKCESSFTPERCQHHLLSELLCVQPKMIIALGYDVGKYFDPTINQAGYNSHIMERYQMITTDRTIHTMGNQPQFEAFCHHMLRAKQQVDSTS